MTKTYAELVEEIERLQALAKEAEKAEKRDGLAEIHEVMKVRGLSVDEVVQSLRGKGPKGPARVNQAAPRYRDPATGNTWSGMGRTPGWLVERVSSGASRDSFLI